MSKATVKGREERIKSQDTVTQPKKFDTAFSALVGHQKEHPARKN